MSGNPKGDDQGVDDARFAEAIARIDSANAEDPKRVPGSDAPGAPLISAELLYARRLTGWLARLYPNASEPLRLAARGQHVRRWKVPRETYPMDRAGYHRWRTAMYSFHADQLEPILRELQYDDATIARVRSLLKKERIKSDPDAQALEDAICLTFLEFEFADFAAKYADEKLIVILKRTWAKMSSVGHDAALKLPLGPREGSLVERALS